MRAAFVEQKSNKSDKYIRIEEMNEKFSYSMIKRLIDLIFSLFGIIFLMPLFIIVSLLIKLEDPNGSVFFKQIRVGKNGKEFYIYKFRTMVIDAEKQLEDLFKYNEVNGLMFKMKEDPRITKIGKFLRNTSLDEFPQLFNVLKGEMSLVGPRPPLPREVKEYTNYHKQRLYVLPGCTGLWQVTSRNNVGFEEMVMLDLEYIEKRSIFFDLRIIISTFNVLLINKTGY
ncbi:sugar transferase [Bacillus sp. 1NLA3E]|uniref:sugar transferase n=1 Tax=Bacillus sp. 1NLA3E TaxID=666686 RepID=UPI000247EB8C|nr:sugar transferase [Bacillus sp. 1NLA3E]AGK55757.1 undecaprenyl-phosphate galactosephosphotransferase [Bacillus sp. 1NLA3E]